RPGGIPDHQLRVPDPPAHLHMTLAEMASRPFSPGAHEIVVQASANHGTGQRNEPARPFLNYLRAGLRGDTLDDAGYKPADDFPLQQLAADVHPGGTGSCDPELGGFFLSIELEAVNQAQLLNRTQSYGREDTQIGHDRE